MAWAEPKQNDLSAEQAEDGLREFDCVRLLVDVPVSEGVMWLYDDETAEQIPAGAEGTIVDIHDGVYEVEFNDPPAALVALRADQVARTWRAHAAT